ncbi:MAG: DHHA1 domain-containing protein, partial [Bacteroidota bacterium]|nr:DHHA1 domain-containing protein [Bacteroidota bacterium]
NHTATHLLHHALRKHIGTHVEQKGSLVAPDRLRFDISHFSKVSSEDIMVIEKEVNAMIAEDLAFDDRRNIPISEAKAMGAMALFGEKYGDEVRVVKFGPSVELCGGTHVPRTGLIGPFKIVSEGALAAGIRRLEAITSEAAEKLVSDKLAKLEAITVLLKNTEDPAGAVQQLIDRNSALEKELEKRAREKVQQLAQDLPSRAKPFKQGLSLLIERLDLNAQGLKDLGHLLRNARPGMAVVAGSVHDGKPLLAISIGKEFSGGTGASAVALIKQISAEIKGGGGGQPDYATAGGKDASGLDRALAKAEEELMKL